MSRQTKNAMSNAGVQPLEPWAQHVINKGFVKKMLQTWESPLSGNMEKPAVTRYLYPAPGDMVELSGVSRRPELNGAVGEVLAAEVDEAGRVPVRIFATGEDAPREMRVQASRLKRLKASSSEPSLLSRTAASSYGVPSRAATPTASPGKSRSALAAAGDAMSAAGNPWPSAQLVNAPSNALTLHYKEPHPYSALKFINWH
mmetsp:Transcript_6417/g.13150  ORF Transcript_6417/g.13150 Transcript_6417/m.13150 type:complete len:201 (-) Transcript_6417:33-635(-)